MQAMQRRATTQLAQQADLGMFSGLCEEVEARSGMRAREKRLEEYWVHVRILKTRIFVLPLGYRRLHLLANAPKHAEIRLLQHIRGPFVAITSSQSTFHHSRSHLLGRRGHHNSA